MPRDESATLGIRKMTESDPVKAAARRTPPEVISAASVRPTCLIILPWDLHHTGGVTQVVANLHHELLLASEIEPLVMVTRWSAFRPVEQVVDGRRTVYLRLWPPWTERGGIIGLLKWVIASPVWIFDLLRLCQHYRVSAINVHYPGLHVFPIALLRFLRLYRGALILSFHGGDLDETRKAGRIERVLWRFVLRYTTAIVACSKMLAIALGEFAGKAARKVHTIQNGLNMDNFLKDVDRESALPSDLLDREFILAIATWEWGKGLDVLLRAFTEVRRSHQRTTLVLVGRPSEAESSLRALAEELGIAKDVLFFGNVPHREVGLYLEHAKAFCLPSRGEGLPIVILEAGAYRLPVVATRVGGIPEIIIDGDSGLLFERDDVTALVAALARILSDPDFARRLGERLHRRVVTDFSSKRLYKEYRKLML